jgi:hypothetical protein
MREKNHRTSRFSCDSVSLYDSVSFPTASPKNFVFIRVYPFDRGFLNKKQF